MKYSIVNIVECGKSIGIFFRLYVLKCTNIDVMRLDVFDSFI